VALVLVLVLGAKPVAPDLSGRWAFRMNPDFKGNQTVEDCTFKHSDKKLIVTCHNRSGTGAVMTGSVSGEKVTWGMRGLSDDAPGFSADVATRTEIGMTRYNPLPTRHYARRVREEKGTCEET